jgi:hypothetical protein
MASIQEVLSELKAEKQRGGKIVKNWHDGLPSTSKWYPGSKADPLCKECEGMGYLRLDLPVGHRYFGKVFTCECVGRMMNGRSIPETP